ncbi:MAG: sensor histidine kinase [Dictyoglomaceae bacterium]
MKLAGKLTLIFTVIFSLLIFLFSSFYYLYTKNLLIDENKKELFRVSLGHALMMGRRMSAMMGVQRFSLYYISSPNGVIQDPFDLGFVYKEGILKNSNGSYLLVKRGEYIIGKDITSIILALNRLKINLTIFSIIGIIFSSFLGYFLSQRFLTPIRKIIQTAKEIDTKRLKKRIDLPKNKDELWELGDTLNNMLNRVERAYSIQEQFIADVSHELKTPLTNILGYVRLLQRWGKEDKKVLEESLDIIKETGEKMRELIDVLLEMARVQEEIPKEKINIKDFFGERKGYYEKLYPDFDFHVFIDSNTEIISSKGLLEIIFNILVENAVKNSISKKVIELGFSNGKLFVRDFGRGIPKEEIEKIFERFYKVDKSRSSSGYGLGLSLAKKLADILGLEIGVESKEGEGSTFYLKL